MVRASFELRDREIWDGVKGPTVRPLLFTISSHSLYQGIVKNKIFKFLLYNGRVTYKYFVKLGRVYLLLVSKLLLCNVMLWKGHSPSHIIPLLLYTIKGWFTDPWIQLGNLCLSDNNGLGKVSRLVEYQLPTYVHTFVYCFACLYNCTMWMLPKNLLDRSMC